MGQYYKMKLLINLSAGFFLGSALTALGTVLRRKLFRTSFVILVVCWLLLSPLWGMGIETAGGYFLAYLSNLAAGVLIATAYFSKVSYEFY